jgi:very-short-patch-repair endonuclease
MASETAWSLRKKMTRQEVKLWVHLRDLKRLGHHFRRQSPIPPYIVDFECRRSKLIIEIDGGQHSFAKEARRDAARDQNLQRAGYRVLRFWNNQVDREFDGVMETILDALDKHPRLAPRQARREPPSPKGEG